MKKLLLFIIFIATALQVTNAQTLDAWVEAGDEALERKDFYSAYKYFGIALEYDEDQTDVWYKYAESARQFNIYTKAEMAYTKVIGSDQQAEYPMTAYYLGKVKQRLGSYDEAMAMFQKFLTEQSITDQKIIEDAEKGIEDSNWAKNIVENPADIEVRNMDDLINSPFSDFGVAFKGDTMFYSSLKFVNYQDSINPPREYGKILQSINNLEGVPLPENVNLKGKTVAHTAFNQDYSRVYFTICDYTTTTEIDCDIFTSLVSTMGNWSPAEKLPINAMGFTTTQPNIGYDRNGENETLYFTTDRPGGKGNLDIWSCKIMEDGTLGIPKNLEDINTEEDDVTPFFHQSTQTLYFSSEGYQSLGGFDILSAQKTIDQWRAPEHLGSPTNSGFDDLYYAIFEEGSKAYLSSNRPDSSAIFWDETKEACCYDIYTFDQKLTVDLRVLTFNELDSVELIGTKVQLYEILASGEEILIDSITNSSGNDFDFALLPGLKYKVKSTKKGFSTAVEIIDLLDPELQGEPKIEKRLYMSPGIELDVLTFDNIDSLALNGVRVELYEITASGEEILADSKSNINSNDFNFSLKRGKKYKIKGIKDGFPTIVEPLDLSDPELANESTIEKKLYLGQLLEILTFDDRTKKALNGATIELLKIKPNGTTELNTKKTNPDGNDFLFPLDLGQKYQINVKRLGYESVTQDIEFDSEMLKKAGGKITIEVYLKRTSLDDFLPLTLYFDNDYPDPRSGNPRTKQDYIETNKAYYAKKDEFVTKFTEGLSKNDQFIVGRQFRQFFDVEVKRARRDLEDFTKELVILLENGGSYTINLKGYASPLASDRYNDILSKRRIDCVRNYFEGYKEGKLIDYLNKSRLIIRESAFGESTAPKGKISDNAKDKKGSVYSVVASIERRVEIVEVENR
jgi:tetratricopeptide (TPR) repeat protein/outer membrane protein OmpA-like peptidoglycan-associated protein